MSHGWRLLEPRVVFFQRFGASASTRQVIVYWHWYALQFRSDIQLTQISYKTIHKCIPAVITVKPLKNIHVDDWFCCIPCQTLLDDNTYWYYYIVSAIVCCRMEMQRQPWEASQFWIVEWSCKKAWVVQALVNPEIVLISNIPTNKLIN